MIQKLYLKGLKKIKLFTAFIFRETMAMLIQEVSSFRMKILLKLDNCL